MKKKDVEKLLKAQVGELTWHLGHLVDARSSSCAARACSFTTLHNRIHTPLFMPVATVGALRSQNTETAEAMGFPVLLANTFHLLLRPGPEIFQKFGSLHNFIKWPGSILTDSGGFQVFSMPKNVRLSEEGAIFKSYIDGKSLVLSPETSIGFQKLLGSDIMMAMDRCISSNTDEAATEQAAEITARWAERSLEAKGASPQALFGIIQGACYPRLRRQSAKQICSLPFDGFAIGGLAVGESWEERKEIMELTSELMPADKPKYLMGVGTPADLLEAVRVGIDMFDCILPTAMGIQGTAFTYDGRLELRRTVYRLDDRPIFEGCSCTACRKYSRAYIHHLIKSGEYFGRQLAGIHNLAFYKTLMSDMRAAILNGSFEAFYGAYAERLRSGDPENPPMPSAKNPKKQRPLPSLGRFEIIRQKDFYSIREKASGEIMHSVNEPLEEAENLYVKQTDFQAMLRYIREGEIVLWDAGLGAGTNAMAAVFEWERLNPKRRLRMISFEKDTDAFYLSGSTRSFFLTQGIPHLPLCFAPDAGAPII